jgi:hypothetical protein
MTHTPTKNERATLVFSTGEHYGMNIPINRAGSFIVHAVNCHDELVEALKVAKYALADGWTEASTKATKESIENAIKITTKAIQEAEGKP